MGSLSGGGRAIRPPTARSFPGQGLRTHAKNTLRTAPLQPAPEPVYEGGARSPPKPTNPYIVVSISQKRHFEQQKCKGFLHRVCEAFFGRVYRKNGAKRGFWPSFGQKRPSAPRRDKKRAGGDDLPPPRGAFRGLFAAAAADIFNFRLVVVDGADARGPFRAKAQAKLGHAQRDGRQA